MSPQLYLRKEEACRVLQYQRCETNIQGKADRNMFFFPSPSQSPFPFPLSLSFSVYLHQPLPPPLALPPVPPPLAQFSLFFSSSIVTFGLVYTSDRTMTLPLCFMIMCSILGLDAVIYFTLLCAFVFGHVRVCKDQQVYQYIDISDGPHTHPLPLFLFLVHECKHQRSDNMLSSIHYKRNECLHMMFFILLSLWNPKYKNISAYV